MHYIWYNFCRMLSTYGDIGRCKGIKTEMSLPEHLHRKSTGGKIRAAQFYMQKTVAVLILYKEGIYHE